MRVCLLSDRLEGIINIVPRNTGHARTETRGSWGREVGSQPWHYKKRLTSISLDATQSRAPQISLNSLLRASVNLLGQQVFNAAFWVAAPPSIRFSGRVACLNH